MKIKVTILPMRPLALGAQLEATATVSVVASIIPLMHAADSQKKIAVRVGTADAIPMVTYNDQIVSAAHYQNHYYWKGPAAVLTLLKKEETSMLMFVETTSMNKVDMIVEQIDFLLMNAEKDYPEGPEVLELKLAINLKEEALITALKEAGYKYGS